MFVYHEHVQLIILKNLITANHSSISQPVVHNNRGLHAKGIPMEAGTKVMRACGVKGESEGQTAAMGMNCKVE